MPVQRRKNCVNFSDMLEATRHPHSSNANLHHAVHILLCKLCPGDRRTSGRPIPLKRNLADMALAQYPCPTLPKPKARVHETCPISENSQADLLRKPQILRTIFHNAAKKPRLSVRVLSSFACWCLSRAPESWFLVTVRPSGRRRQIRHSSLLNSD